MADDGNDQEEEEGGLAADEMVPSSVAGTLQVMTDRRTMSDGRDGAMDDERDGPLLYPDLDWGVQMDGRHLSQIRQRAGIRPLESLLPACLFKVAACTWKPCNLALTLAATRSLNLLTSVYHDEPSAKYLTVPAPFCCKKSN
ncbi:hypothetical protein ACJZ2D_015988 [Fusarium nematophilum]